ncbi:branched-chain amino acid ABC transporter permease [Dermatophilaceae bacterium Sec6.4]
MTARLRIGVCLGSVAALAIGWALAPSSAITTLCLYIVVAQSWNLIGGLTGYASFGQVVFFGVGGYAVGLLMVEGGLSFWLALPLGAFVAALYAVVLGLPLLRLRGDYFAVATLVAAEATQALAAWQPAILGQGAGLTITTVGEHRNTHYLGSAGFAALSAVLALVTVVVVAGVRRSRFGAGLRVIRDDEQLAGALGVKAGRSKLLVFALSGLLAGLAGGVEAFRAVVLTPGQMFDPKITVLTIAMVVVGGVGTTFGPVVGAVVLTLLSAAIGAVLPSAGDFVLAVIIVATVVVTPRGLLGNGLAFRALWSPNRTDGATP